MSDIYKEIKPVIYAENGIRLDLYSYHANEMCFPAHWHDRMELLQICSGELEVYLDNEHFIATPGQTVLIVPGIIHCAYPGKDGVSYNVISFELVKFTNTTIASNKHLIPIINQAIKFTPLLTHPAITKAIDELMDALTNKKLNSLYAVSKVYEIVSLLYQHSDPTCRQPQKFNEQISLVLDYINTHYTEDISAKDISHKFGYDETYFCRRFKKTTGISMMRYIRILRLELAQKLLKDSTESIGNISWKCGFTDTHYFSNCFKKHFGVTPTEFRLSSHPKQ